VHVQEVTNPAKDTVDAAAKAVRRVSKVCAWCYIKRLGVHVQEVANPARDAAQNNAEAGLGFG
jgi:hypothetical protein